MADESGDFRFAGAYVELNLRDNTEAQGEEVRRRFESEGPIQIPLSLDEKSVDETGAKAKEKAKEIGDTSPVRVKLELDDASVAAFEARVKAASDAAARSSSVSGSAAQGDAGAAAAGGAGGYGAAIGAAAGLGAGALGGVTLLTVPALFTAIGVAAEKSQPQVAAAFAGMTTAAKQAAQTGFEPMIPALEGIANQAKATVSGLEPDFANAATATAPLLQAVGAGFLKATQEGVGASISILQGLGPVAQALGDDFGKAEQGIGGFLTNIDVNQAAAGLGALGNVVKDDLPAIGSLISDVAPLGTALLNVLAPALSTIVSDFGFLRPVAQGVGSALQVLSPEITALAGPLLGVEVATKALTGSWTDWSGALSKGVAILQGSTGAAGENLTAMDRLAKTIGISTDAAKNAAVADAQAALDKAKLTAAADAETASQATEAAATAKTTEARVAAAAAARTAADSAKAEATAQAELNTVMETSTFSFGPLGAAIGVVGGALSLLGLNASKAAPPVTDLTNDLLQLAKAAPGATSGIIDGNQQLTDLVNKAQAAGVSVQSLLAAYNQGPAALQRFSDSLSAQQKAYGDTVIGISTVNGQQTQVQNLQRAQSVESIKTLVDQVKSGQVAYDDLSPTLRGIVDKYRDQDTVLGTVGTSIDTLNQRQKANAAVAGQGRDATTLWVTAIAQATEQTGLFGGNLLGTTQSMFQFEKASGETTLNLEAFEKAQLAATQANFSAQDSFAQLDQAARQAQQQVASTAQSVANARHGEEQAAQGVVTAERGVETALQGVATAEQNLQRSQQSEQQAQVALTQARQAAEQQLVSLHLQLQDQTAAEESAQLKLNEQIQTSLALGVTQANAQAIAATASHATTAAQQQQVQAAIDLVDAQNSLNDTMNTGTNLRQTAAQADQAGVDNAPSVLAAQQALIQAQQQEVSSAQAVATAQQGVVTAQQGVKDAEYQAQQAHIATQQAVVAESNANTAYKAALDAASRSTDITSEAGVRNRDTLIGLYDAQIAAGKSTTDATTAVETEGEKLGITKQQVDAVIGSIQAVPPSVTFSIVGQPSLDVSQLIQNAQAQGININSLGLPSSVIGNARAGFAGQFPTHATGGSVKGIGGPTDDLNLAWLSDREFVQPVSSVDYYGSAFMEAIRTKSIPKEALPQLASGGQPIGTALLGINDRLTGWDGLLGATSLTLKALGDKGAPTLPPVLPLPSISASVTGQPGAHSASAAEAQAYALSRLGVYGWGPDQMQPLTWLWNKESGWNSYAVNPTSGAAGIAQSLGHGPVTLGDYMGQIDWGLGYIEQRYGSPAAAWQHEVADNWYDQGGYLLPGQTTLATNGTRDREAILDPGMTRTLEAIHAAVTNGTATAPAAPNITIHVHANSSEDVHQIVARVKADLEFALLTRR